MPGRRHYKSNTTHLSMSEDHRKFQWISVVYLILFVLAVFAPSMVRGDFLGIHEQGLEEMLIFIFGLSGISIFMFYERSIERKEKEHEDVVNVYEKSKRELIASYQYIGSLNRQLEMMKKLANDTSVSIYGQDLHKDLLHTLVTAASGSLGGSTTLLRFVRLDKLRTEKEFHHPLPFKNKGSQIMNGLSIHNKELKNLHDQGLSYSYIESDGHKLMVVPSDRRSGSIKAFMIVKLPANLNEDEFDPSVLKVFANQAELVYRAMRDNEDEDRNPLDLVESVTNKEVGKVD